MPGLKPSPATQANHTSQPRLLSGPCHRICTSHHLATPSPLLLSDAAGLGLGVVAPAWNTLSHLWQSDWDAAAEVPLLPASFGKHGICSDASASMMPIVSIPVQAAVPPSPSTSPSSHPRTHHTLPLHTRNLSILTSKHAPEGPGFPRPIFHTASSHRDDVFGVSTTRLRNTTYEQPHASHTPAPQHAHTYGFWS